MNRQDEDADWKSFWDELDREISAAQYYLCEAYVESQEEAIRGIYKATPERPDGYAPDVIRRRNVSSDYDSLDYYIEEGQQFLPRLVELAEKQRITPELLKLWTKVRFCHGFVVAHAMDNSDGWFSQRGRLHNIDDQRRWLAAQILPMLGKRGTVKAAFSTLLSVVMNNSTDLALPVEDRKFFRRMLNTKGEDWAKALSPKRFSTVQMRKILASDPRVA